MRWRIVVAAALFASALPMSAATLQLSNMSHQTVDAVFWQIEPARTDPKSARMQHEDSFDTKLPIDANAIYALSFRRHGKDFARPVIFAGVVELAMLLAPPDSSPYIVLRPRPDDKIWAEVGTAIHVNGSPRPSSLFCVNGTVREWDGRRVLVLADGMFLELAGIRGNVPERGPICACGRVIDAIPQSPIDRFDVGSICPLQ